MDYASPLMDRNEHRNEMDQHAFTIIFHCKAVWSAAYEDMSLSLFLEQSNQIFWFWLHISSHVKGNP